MKASVLVLIILALSACAQPGADKRGPTVTPPAVAASPVEARPDTLTLFQQFVDSVNRGDVDSALQFLSEDIVWERGGQCPPTACIGKTAVRREIMRDVATHHALTIVSAESPGEVVKVRIELRSDGTLRGKVDRIVQTLLLSGSADKIAVVRVDLDTTDPQTAALLATQGRSPQ